MRTIAILLIAAMLLIMTPAQALAQTPTDTPTPTLTPTPNGADAYEPNDTPDTAYLVGVAATLNATLHTGDVDWWEVYLKAGHSYRLEANVTPGGDPRAALYSSALGLIAQNDDCAPGDYSACIIYTPLADGNYYLEISSQVAGLFASYTLRIIEVLPTPTPTDTATPTITPTPTPNGADAYEPNDTLDTAYLVGVGSTFNATLHTDDQDWWKVYLKAGHSYLLTDSTCLTFFRQYMPDMNIA